MEQRRIGVVMGASVWGAPAGTSEATFHRREPEHEQGSKRLADGEQFDPVASYAVDGLIAFLKETLGDAVFDVRASDLPD